MDKRILEYDLIHHPNWFYRDRSNNLYPQYKSKIQEIIDPQKPNTFLSILKEMDYPFLEDIWLDTLEFSMLHGKGLKYVFDGYIAIMKMKLFSSMTFKDSRYDKDTLIYLPNISWNHIKNSMGD